MKKCFIFLTLCLISTFALGKNEYCKIPETKRSEDAKNRNFIPLKQELEKKGLKIGAPLFIRIFKEDKVLEVWVKKKDKFEFFKKYPICAMSGFVGPKVRKGDKQAPEGFYTLSAGSLNPSSAYHLSVNVGYPNHFDRSMNATGSHIMIHGNCCSVGCFAMTDRLMEEIYTLIYHSIAGGQKEIPLHIFPFHLTEENLCKKRDGSWYHFWSMLQQGYLAFEKTKQIPDIKLKNRSYEFAQLP